MTSRCYACRTRPRQAGRYLCPSCWSALPLPARRTLTRRDRYALTRLRSLHTQLDRGVPLAEITVEVPSG